MGLLVDTCTFVWLTSAPERLSEKAKSLLDDRNANILLSDVSVWELGLKWRAGKIGLPQPPRSWVTQQTDIWQVDELAIGRGHVFRESELEGIHRDPFDRLLVAQAIEEGLTLLTPDETIHRYPVSATW